MKIYTLKQFNKISSINEYNADKQDLKIIINDILNKIGRVNMDKEINND